MIVGSERSFFFHRFSMKGSSSMQLICLSRGSYSRGKELAEELSRELGYPCLDRESIVGEAMRKGIAVGKMETAIVKPHTFVDFFAQEKAHFIAFATHVLSQRALEGNLVYHGMAGHLLLPGVDNILKVRVVADMESRIEYVMNELGLDRMKARKFIEQVDEDRARRQRAFYGVDWQDSELYDFMVNTDRVSITNAVSAVRSMTELPEFMFTPLSIKSLRDLSLASRCRLALFETEETYELEARVRASDGRVSVSYPPWQENIAHRVPEVVGTVQGVEEVNCTVAQTSLLWIEEQFSPDDPAVADVAEIAKKWDAAVELVQVPASDELEEELRQEQDGSRLGEGRSVFRPMKKEYDGGIEDDSAEAVPEANQGIVNTCNRLIAAGHGGCSYLFQGSLKTLFRSLQQQSAYSLVVVGNLFTSKEPNVRTRRMNELVAYISDRVKVPTVLKSELRQQFLFGKRQALHLVGYAIVSALIYYLVFTHQIEVLEFTRLEGGWRILSVVIITLFVPLLAYLWGTVGKLLLKMFKLE